jgi:deazaflavin-dependent oxidoreductase (nitroreductase family)
MTAHVSTPQRSGFGEAARWLTRVTNPLLGLLAGHRFFTLWGIVHHRGRQSGTDYQTPVVVRVTPDGFLIPMPWGPKTQWARNVLAAGGCTIRWNGSDHQLGEPRIVDRDQAGAAFTAGMRMALRGMGTDNFLHLRRI